MSTNLLEMFGDTSVDRVEAALSAMRQGRGVLVVDNADRENEGDLIYAAETMTSEQMAFMIRECSGIVSMLDAKMLQLNEAIIEARAAQEENAEAMS